MKNPSVIPVFADAIMKPGAEYTTFCRFKYYCYKDGGAGGNGDMYGMVMVHSGRNPIASADGHATSHTGKELSVMLYQLDSWYEDTAGTKGEK